MRQGETWGKRCLHMLVSVGTRWRCRAAARSKLRVECGDQSTGHRDGDHSDVEEMLLFFKKEGFSILYH